jgi:hypothetical protein
MSKIFFYRQELTKQLFLILLVLVLFTVTMAAPFIEGRDVFGGRVILRINCMGPLVLYAISQPNVLPYPFGPWLWGGLYIQTPVTREYLYPPIIPTECVTGDALPTPIPCGIGMFFFFTFAVPAKPMLQVGSTPGVCPLAALEIPGLPESGIIEGGSGLVGIRELIPLEIVGAEVPWTDMLTPAMDFVLGITGGSLDSLTSDQRLDYQYLYGNYGVGYTPSKSQIVESDGTINALKYDTLKSELNLPTGSIDSSYFNFDALFSGLVDDGGVGSLSSDQQKEIQYVFDTYGGSYTPSSSVAGSVGGEVNFISYDATKSNLGVTGESLNVYVAPAEIYLRNETTVDGLTASQKTEYQYLFNTYGVGYTPTASSLGIGGANPDIIGYDYARTTLSLPTASPATYLTSTETYLRTPGVVAALTPTQLTEYQYLFDTYGTGWASYGF